MGSALAYGGLVVAVIAPVVIAANSPLLQWREPIYRLAGLAGVLGLCFLLVQALLAGGDLPRLGNRRGRSLHRWFGATLSVLVLIHVVGLWITSPPDVIDALLLRSPTSFSVWGVIAMWAVAAASLMALLRHRFIHRFGGRRGLHVWRHGHTTLALITVTATIVHALLIEGTMGLVSKWVLCFFVAVATGRLIVKQWTGRTK